MHTLALAANGHTRVIPNGVARVQPLRFVWLEDGPCVVDAGDRMRHLIGSRLHSIGGRDPQSVHDALRPCLAGTGQRQKVIGAMMLAWPQAQRAIGLGTGVVEFEAEDGAVCTIEPAPAESVEAEALYPVHETGIAHRLIHRNALAESANAARSGKLLSALAGLAGLVCPAGGSCVRRCGNAGAGPGRDPCASQRIAATIDPGGPARQSRRRLPDRHRFSLPASTRCLRPTALVSSWSTSSPFRRPSSSRRCSSITRVPAVSSARRWGDAARFFAEGGTDPLAQSGLKVRYSTGFHDWQDGRADPQLTPPEIAVHMVAAGTLMPDIAASPASHDFRTGHDPALQAARRLIA